MDGSVLYTFAIRIANGSNRPRSGLPRRDKLTYAIEPDGHAVGIRGPVARELLRYG
jgi:hypothetical protein